MQRILPIQASRHKIRRLSITQRFRSLQRAFGSHCPLAQWPVSFGIWLCLLIFKLIPLSFVRSPVCQQQPLVDGLFTWAESACRSCSSRPGQLQVVEVDRLWVIEGRIVDEGGGRWPGQWHPARLQGKCPAHSRAIRANAFENLSRH